MSYDDSQITRLLRRIREGDEQARSLLADIVYAQLKRAAARLIRAERPGHTLQTTALVNETFVRLLSSPLHPNDRQHFFAIAAAVMRRVLVDHARAHLSQKRAGLLSRVEFSDALAYAQERSTELIALDEALERLAQLDPRQASIVQLRFFGGLDEAEIAVMLGISTRTVKRDWSVAKAWLNAHMQT